MKYFALLLVVIALTGCHDPATEEQKAACTEFCASMSLESLAHIDDGNRLICKCFVPGSWQS